MSEDPVPRDMPDEQADADPGTAGEEAVDTPDAEVPGTDEAGTRRRSDEGDQSPGTVHPDPHESPA